MRKNVLAALFSLSLCSCFEEATGNKDSGTQVSPGSQLLTDKDYAMSFGSFERKLFRLTMSKPGLLRVESQKDFAGQVEIEILNTDSVAIGSAYSNLYLPLKAGEYYVRFKSGSNALTSKYRLSLDSVDMTEYNNDVKNAAHIGFDTPIRAKLLPAYDVDSYTFTLNQPTTFYLRLDSIPTNLSLVVKLQDAEGSAINSVDLTKGLDTAVVGYQLKSGTYSLFVSDNYRGGSSDKPFKISLNKYLVDTLEYNNDLGSAKEVQLGQAFKGNIWPAGDVDYYKIQIADTGAYQILVDSISSKIKLKYSIFDVEGTQLSTSEITSGVGQSVKFAKSSSYYIKFESIWKTTDAFGEKLHTIVIKKN